MRAFVVVVVCIVVVVCVVVVLELVFVVAPAAAVLFVLPATVSVAFYGLCVRVRVCVRQSIRLCVCL